MGFALNLLVGMLVLSAALWHAPSFATGAELMQPVEGTLQSSPQIVINEVMYDPRGTELEGEWIELYNPGAETVNVTGWTISDQEGPVDFTFPAMEFPAGGLALVWVMAGQNSTDFVEGKAEFFMGKSSTLLSNNGDDVLLANDTGATVDFMSYGPWGGASIGPVPADFDYRHSNATAPEGYSLARLDGGFLASVPTPLYPNGDDSVPGLLITRVHYHAWGENEFYTIHNPLEHEVDISSWCLTDLEGAVSFPVGTIIGPGQYFTVSQNSANYLAQTLLVPDFEIADADPVVPDMVTVTTVPVLANAGDELLLRNNFGSAADVFAYGSSSYSGPGWDSLPVPAEPQGRVARRNFDNGYIDTNTSADWLNIRQYIVGQSDFTTSDITVPGPMTLFASPDSSFGAITEILDNATQSIRLTVYELTDHHLAQRLVSAAGRGVEVNVFLEGSPVGGISAAGLFHARCIAEAGGQVRMMTNDPDNGIYARYSFVHAKYAVVDSNILIIMSENWGQSGVPQPGTAGNRGWGAAIRDAALAGYFSDVFAEDWNPGRTDSVAFDQYHKLWSAGSDSSYAPQPLAPMFPRLTVESASVVTPVLSPDTSLSSDTVLGLLASASQRLLVQEFYIYKHWGSRADGSVETTPNVYLEAVIDAARRGCHVRILLDSTYYNIDPNDPIDNDDTVEYVNAIALAEGLDMEAKLVNLDEHGFEKIHNKGLVADDSVLISSINWNLNSVTGNRESGVIIRNRQAADYFAEIFSYDWIDDLTPPFAHFRAAEAYLVNAPVNLNATTSSDNVGIVNYTWKVDGLVMCYSEYFSSVFTVPGQYAVELTVRDAWGNAASHSSIINITLEGTVPDGEAPAGGDRTLTLMIGAVLLVPIFMFIVLIFVAMKRRP